MKHTRLRRAVPILKNKYFLIFIFFLFWLLIFDSNNLIDQYQQMKELRQLRRDKEYYQKKIEQDTRKLKELESDSKSLEKFAREQYLMKRKNEDIFIIREEK
jgi:cell division protein FtsB